MNTLDQIGVQEGSDRSSRIHNYLSHYEKILDPYKDTEIDILEIGGRTASSARVWTKFFSKATLHVVDTHPVSELETMPRVVLHKIGSFSTETLEKLAVKIQPTLAFDDGTHRWSHQLTGLNSIFPSLRPGGLFIIEDLQTSFGSYRDTHGDAKESTAEFLARLIEYKLAGSQGTRRNNTSERYLATSVEKISVVRQVAILQKTANDEILYARESLERSKYASSVSRVTNEPYNRVNGTLLDASNRQVSSFKEILDAKEVRLEDSVSGVLANVQVHGSGLCVTKDGFVLSETLNNIENVAEYAHFFKRSSGKKWALTSVTNPEFVERVTGRQHVLLKGAWDSNYGHWLYDVLPRLHLLKKLNLKDKPLLVISPRKGAMAKVVYDSLSLAGFDKGDVIEHDGAPREYESLVILGRTTRHPIVKSPAATRFLEDLTSEIHAGSDKRIYLSRNNYSRRRLSNEDELHRILTDKGFRIIHPEELNLEEQVSLFKGAEIVAGNMGAAFSNLAFSPNNVKVLTLFTPSMLHDFFYDIVCHKKGTYVGVQGLSKDAKPGMGSDFEISEKQLLQGFKYLGI